MAQAKSGDKVKIHYTGTFEDGTEFDSSRKREPVMVELGTGMLISGFEKLILGMSVGETKTGTIESDDAYGEYDVSRLIEAERSQMPDDAKVEVGQVVELKRPDGVVIPAVVSAVTDEKVTFDANHPLAGKNLTFEVELLEIVSSD